MFHHGLIKILIQHQLSLSCKSWDDFLVGCKLGPTQYWPNPPPKPHRKHKAPLKSKVDAVHNAELKYKELQEANPPISSCISNDGTTTDQSSSDKCLSTPTKVKGRLTENEDVNTVNYENPS